MSSRLPLQILSFSLLLGLLGACADKSEDCPPELDEDGDGYCGSADCDLKDGSINPDATDRYQDGVDQDCDGADGTDGDGDGYPPGDVDVTDCDDNDGAVGPGATELCDGLDNDCDGVVDEDDATDASTWYADGDGDGHGNAGSPTDACDRPDGHVASSDDCDDADAERHPDADDFIADGTDQDCDGVDGADRDGDGFIAGLEGDGDCDDADPDVYPGATERCDDIDNDCDAIIDEDDAEDASTWFVDADGDGYGDADISTGACDEPEGYVSSADDCDDARTEVNPDAEETPYDGLDNDCFGSTVDDDLDEDGYDLDEDCDDEDASSYPGVAETCDDGLVNDCAGGTAVAMAECGLTGTLSLSSADARFAGSEEGYRSGLGVAVAGAGDVNGDGLDDLLIGAPGVSSDSVHGAVYVVSWSDADGALSTWASLAAGESGDQAGISLAMGAFDDDNSMLLVGAPGDDTGSDEREDSGGVYVVVNFEEGAQSLSEAGVKLSGYGDHAVGSSIAAAGNLAGDDDGYYDLIVGAPMLNDVPTNGGGVYFELGPITADLSLSEGTHTGRLVGEVDGDYAGTSVAGGADTNGDGVSDVLVSAVGHTESGGPAESGAAYLIQGPLSPDVLDLGDAGARLQGVATYDAAGTAVAFAGDVDGDGFDDVLVGATGWSSARGLVYLMLGPVTASESLSDAELRFRGEEEEAYLGQSISAPGDVDGDGSIDLLVGAPGSGDAAGAAYLILGPLADASDSVSDAQVKMEGVEAGDQAGEAVGGSVDVNEDGFQDLLVGAPLVDDATLGADSGAAYVVFGGGY